MQAEPQHIDWDKLIDLLEKTPAEREMFVAALPADEQVLFAQLQQWKEDALLSGALQLDTAQAWKQTLGKMDKPKAPVRAVSFRWQRWVSAACLLLAAALLIAAFTYQRFPESLPDLRWIGPRANSGRERSQKFSIGA